jgi:hypothetical protein
MDRSMRPQIYVERQQNAWAVQELDAPLTNTRFQTKTSAIAEGEREARRLQGDLLVLDRRGRITRWQSFGTRATGNQDWIGQDLEAG